jgi:hypothetical protein
MNIKIIDEFKKVLEKGIKNAPKHTKYVTVEVSSGHMCVYHDYYQSLQVIEAKLGSELIDQTYSDIKLIYDLTDKELIYYDSSGVMHSIYDSYFGNLAKNKNDIAAKNAAREEWYKKGCKEYGIEYIPANQVECPHCKATLSITKNDEDRFVAGFVKRADTPIAIEKDDCEICGNEGMIQSDGAGMVPCPFCGE